MNPLNRVRTKKKIKNPFKKVRAVVLNSDANKQLQNHLTASKHTDTCKGMHMYEVLLLLVSVPVE